MTTYFIWEDGEGCDERSWWTSKEEAEAAKIRYAEDAADLEGDGEAWKMLDRFEVITAEELESRLATLQEEDLQAQPAQRGLYRLELDTVMEPAEMPVYFAQVFKAYGVQGELTSKDSGNGWPVVAWVGSLGALRTLLAEQYDCPEEELDATVAEATRYVG